MADRPILFSAPMIQALLAGRKSQTRRILKGVPTEPGSSMPCVVRFAKGDRLWVRETWRCNGWSSDVATIFYRASEGDGYTAMCEQWPVADHKPLRVETKWASSLHMPRWASRLTLTVIDVRVERLQAISEDDAKAEGLEWVAPTWGIKGIADSWIDDPRLAYARLWNSINGSASWNANPFVVAVTFDVHKCNIDKMKERQT